MNINTDIVYFQKKKPDWALGAKEGESGAKTPTEENPPEIEAEA